MKPEGKFVFFCHLMILVITSYAVENRNLTLTAKSAVYDVYIDGVKQTLVNNVDWKEVDNITLLPFERLIALMAVDSTESCAGVLASVTGDFVVTDATWKCTAAVLPQWFTLGYDDLGWKEAYVIGANGNVSSPEACVFLGGIPMVSEKASWIWTDTILDTPEYDRTIYCRVYLPVCELESPCLNGGVCLRNNQSICSCLPGFAGAHCETVETKQLRITASETLYAVYVDAQPIPLVNGTVSISPDSVTLGSLSRVIAMMAIHLTGSCPGILLSITDDKGDYVVSDSGWKCTNNAKTGWYEPGYDDSAWQTAVEVKLNGDTNDSVCAELPQVNGISSNAFWIWTNAQPLQDVVVYCRNILPICGTMPCQNGATCNVTADRLCACLPGFSGVYCEQNRPINMAANTGDRVTISCRRTSQFLTWWFSNNNWSPNTSVAVVKDCQVQQQFIGSYDVEKLELFCNLVILNVTLSQGGTYACEDPYSNEKPASAQLVVLEQRNSVEPSDNPVLIGQKLTLSCVALYNGYLAPRLKWVDPTGTQLTNDTYTVTENMVSSSVVVQSYFPEIPHFNCTTYFDSTEAPPTDEEGLVATNIPSYVESWITPDITVTCPSGFVRLSGAESCFQMILEGLDWDTAGLRCRMLLPGAYMTSVMSALENDAIVAYLRSLGGNLCTTNAGYWTSGQTMNPDQCGDPYFWKPNNSTWIPFGYENWIGGYPDCYLTLEHCAYFWAAHDFQWNDGICQTLLCPLCEYGPF